MEFTQRQNAIIVGAILGDSTIENAWKNPRLRCAHSIRQKEYLFWKHTEFQTISNKPVLIRQKHFKNGKIYESWQFNTYALGEFHKYWKSFYVNGKKIIPESIDKLLTDPLSLAVWFMDDGHKRTDCNALRLSTDSFSFSEQGLLANVLEKNFGIASTLHKKGKYWNIYIPKLSAIKFVQIIQPYILPSLEYKITLAP